MTNRIAAGALGGGAFGMRVSRPGYDVLAEPFGSAGIALDTRITEMGTVIAAGLIQCGAGPIPFPDGALSYVPVAHISRWDGANLWSGWDLQQANGSGHQWLPAIAIVTTSSIQVVAYTNPWFNTLAYYDPNGVYFAYYVFASG